MTVVELPDAATALVFRTTVGGHSDVVVVGPRTRGNYRPSRDVPTCVRMPLPPGLVRAALGVPADRLVDRSVRLADLWGPAGDRLTAQLVAAGDDTERIRSRLAAAVGGPPNRLVASAVRDLAAGAPVADVAARAGVGERRLRDLFSREVGLSPKHTARIARLRTVLDQAGRRPWAEVAGNAGFYDQAHMISDFRALMGVSPAAYLSGRLPAATPCAMSA